MSGSQHGKQLDIRVELVILGGAKPQGQQAGDSESGAARVKQFFLKLQFIKLPVAAHLAHGFNKGRRKPGYAFSHVVEFGN